MNEAVLVPRDELSRWKEAVQNALRPPSVGNVDACHEERAQTLAYLNLRLASYLK